MSDAAIARLRTAVPAAWAVLVTWLLGTATWLPDFVGVWLSSEATVLAVVAAVTALWHWLWSRIGPHIPNWLEAIVMGHTGTASYKAAVDA
ncbi:hypothetical protein [Demequina flava]|uniref:hypothetical protein n=1 Tax=Demequina flava TaxID=1095025 RepID=UPI0007849EC8|nr:hypothetical protein [Demequina flava]